jgi:LysR family glycine cleavage system transcriptional activator
LRSFEAAARNGSFYKAADELFVTPSAISHQIKSLENFVGVELFERQKRKVEITAAGKQYLRHVQKAFKEIDKGTQELIASHNTGDLSISVTPAFLNHWLLPRISDFYAANPDIDLDINASMKTVDFQRSDIDIAVMFGMGDWDDMETHFLKNSERVPICSPKLLEKHPINSAEDLLTQKLFIVKRRKEEWASWFALDDIEYLPKQRPISFSSSSLAVTAAIKGAGIALADVSLAADNIKKGDLVIPVDMRLTLKKAFYLVYPKNRKMTFAMQAFKEWVIAEMSQGDV